MTHSTCKSDILCNLILKHTIMGWGHELCPAVHCNKYKRELTTSIHASQEPQVDYPESPKHQLNLPLSSMGQWICSDMNKVYNFHTYLGQFWGIFSSLKRVWISRTQLYTMFLSVKKKQHGRHPGFWLFQDGIDLCLVHAIPWIFYNKIYKYMTCLRFTCTYQSIKTPMGI